ncbi:MAG: 2TM domain-containing protein [Candidatus Hydrogenedentes bacterium]|nr:2TM domain-containing protein [Candidatus Hydrogenedentota bacterium]
MSSQDRRFTADEITAIVRRALESQRDRDSTTREELAEIAAQMGISPAQLAQAIDDEERDGGLERAKTAWLQRRRHAFNEHLLSYVIVNGALVAMNLLTTGYPWALWSIFGWGIGLAFDAADTFLPNPEKVTRGAQKALDRERRLKERRGFAKI